MKYSIQFRIKCAINCICGWKWCALEPQDFLSCVYKWLMTILFVEFYRFGASFHFPVLCVCVLLLLLFWHLRIIHTVRAIDVHWYWRHYALIPKRISFELNINEFPVDCRWTNVFLFYLLFILFFSIIPNSSVFVASVVVFCVSLTLIACMFSVVLTSPLNKYGCVIFVGKWSLNKTKEQKKNTRRTSSEKSSVVDLFWKVNDRRRQALKSKYKLQIS